MDLTEGPCAPVKVQVRAALVCTLEAELLSKSSMLKSGQEASEDFRGGSAHVAWPEQVSLTTQDAALWKLRKRWARTARNITPSGQAPSARMGRVLSFLPFHLNCQFPALETRWRSPLTCKQKETFQTGT